MQIKRIVILGPESTGKSVLGRQLAAHYDTAFVPEYAREYLLTNGKDYSFEDLYEIAKGQLNSEEIGISILESKVQNSQHSIRPLLFIDTDLYVMKVWSEFVFNRCDNRILSHIAERKYDYYFLCKPDLDWVEDELREYPDLESRTRLFHYYLDALVNQPVPWKIIDGDYDNRLRQAIEAVNTLL